MSRWSGAGVGWEWGGYDLIHLTHLRTHLLTATPPSGYLPPRPPATCREKPLAFLLYPPPIACLLSQELADGHSLQQTPGSSSQQLMDSMEGLQMTAGMGDSSNPHTPPWQSTPERRSLTSRGMSGPSAFGLLSQTSNSPSHSPHCRSAAGPDATGAFAFTAQRAIGELKSRLSGGLGSGSFGPGQLEGLAGRLSSGEATPQGSGLPGAFVLGSNGSPLTHTGPTNSPRMVRVHGARSPASGSPVASPRSGSPMLDRSQLAPRPASFSHQRGRQVSSSAECTPHKPAQHKPLLSVFARGRDGSSPAGAGASGQSPHHQRATQDFGQQDFGQQDFGQQQAAFQSSTNQVRRQAAAVLHSPDTVLMQVVGASLGWGFAWAPVGKLHDSYRSWCCLLLQHTAVLSSHASPSV